jgi:hypothetical protein
LPGAYKRARPTCDDRERAELRIDIGQSNDALLNTYAEQATAKRKQQASAADQGDYATCV